MYITYMGLYHIYIVQEAGGKLGGKNFKVECPCTRTSVGMP